MALFFQSAYGEMGLIFHDQFGGDVIGILWKPGVMEEKEFKVLASSLVSLVGKQIKSSLVRISSSMAVINEGRYAILCNGSVRVNALVDSGIPF